jgi:lysophospholipid acyltransferase (LPLAT)-like uncharacterized protein
VTGAQAGQPAHVADREPLKRRMRLALIVWFGATLIRLLGLTWRIRAINDGPLRAHLAARKPFIWAFWHGQMLPMLWHNRGAPASVVISSHRDGEIIARIVERFGMHSVRGSTSRGAARALLGIVRELENGTSVAVTPDGPRGPRHSFAPGATIAAQRTGAPIFMLGAWVSRCWELRSWDRFIIPKPFARIVIVYSDPVMVAADSARGAELEAPRFGEMLGEIVARAGA